MPITERSEFARRLYELRAKNGLTQQKLATLIGVTQQSIWKWETDRSEPNIDKLRRLSRLFKVPTDTLLGLSDDEHDGSIKAPLTLDPASRVAGRHGFTATEAAEVVKMSDIEDVVKRLVLRHLYDGQGAPSSADDLREMEERAVAVDM